MPVPVLNNVANAIAVHKEKGLSFMQEFFIVAGSGVSLCMAMDRAANPPLPRHSDFLFSFAASAPGTGILMFGALAMGGPIMANVVASTTLQKNITWSDCFARHEHKHSGLAGITAGVLFSAAVACTSVCAPNTDNKIDITPLVTVGERIMTDLGNATEQSFPRLDLMFSQ